MPGETNMTAPVTALNLRALLDEQRSQDALTSLSRLQPADAAEQLEHLKTPEIIQLLGVEPLTWFAGVFGYFTLERQVEVSRALPRAALASLISAMSADERADLFNRFDDAQRAALLPALAQLERDDLRRLSSYLEGTAGALMTSEYSTLKADMTAGEAIDALRHGAADAETIYQTYVLDAERRLLGTLSLRELILAPADTPVSQLMIQPVISAKVSDTQEQVAKKISRYDLLALPILDRGHRLVGIVTTDDALDVLEQEATEDFHKGASISLKVGNIKTAAIGLLYRKRVFWLVLLVFGNLFSGAGIASFEEIIAANIALVFFLPLLVDSGGNSGSQAATLMVRALATGEVVMRDWLRLLGRECIVALGLGLTMAFAVAGLGLWRGGPDIALVVALSMVLIVIIGSLIGMSLPFLLSRLRLDPATASAPLITSIADATGVLIYLGIASQVLTLSV
jgi:magnesium transporter